MFFREEKRMKEMPKTYDHQIVESKWYEKWEKSGYFHAEPNPDKQPSPS